MTGGEIVRNWACPALFAGAWTIFTVWRAWRAHAGLQTNAYDLSLFDYTLWSTLHGRLGFVPFMHSIFAHHFMPVILLVAPFYALWPSPEWVIVIQTAALAAGALVFYAICRRLGLEQWQALALMVPLLIARRSHSAAASYFYFESLQPMLMFVMVLAWMQHRWRLFWISVALLLTTKEDMALYLVPFAVLVVGSGLELTYDGNSSFRRRLTLAVVAAIWMIAAFTIAIPVARHLEGHSLVNPFFEARFGPIGSGLPAAHVLADRIFSMASLKNVLSMLASVGFLSLLAPRLLLVAAPAVLICLAVAPGNGQNAILGHYVLPILPWVFLSGAIGVARLGRRSQPMANTLLALLILGTIVDAPIVRYGVRPVDPHAAEVLRQMPALDGDVIAMQPNLIPHVPHSFAMRSLEDAVLASKPDEVWLTRVGDLWPSDADGITALIARYQADAEYEQIVGGPLYVFKRRH